MDSDLKTLNVFYSWQSDIKPDGHGRNLIRSALRNAASAVEAKIPGVQLNLDEATRGETGSPDIPNTIFRKIGASDIFVADVSIVNSGANVGRKMPNPNVLIELGYAAGLLGWKRVVMVANVSLGVIDSLPFDIKQKTIGPFRCPPQSDDAQKDKGSIASALGELTKFLTRALEGIVSASPERPVVAVVDEAAVRRQRDLKMLQSLLIYVNPDVIDGLLREAPRRIEDSVLTFWEDFNTLWTASSTHLYDETARELVGKLHVQWGSVMSHGEHYKSGVGDFCVWDTPGDLFPTRASEVDFKKAQREVQELRVGYSELMAHLRTNYVELDLDLLRKESWSRYQEFQRTFAARMELEDS